MEVMAGGVFFCESERGIEGWRERDGERNMEKQEASGHRMCSGASSVIGLFCGGTRPDGTSTSYG